MSSAPRAGGLGTRLRRRPLDVVFLHSCDLAALVNAELRWAVDSGAFACGADVGEIRPTGVYGGTSWERLLETIGIEPEADDWAWTALRLSVSTPRVSTAISGT